MDKEFLEHYYKQVILPLYADAVTINSIRWKDHGKIAPDTWAHYFEDEAGREFVLVYEDFPDGSYLSDSLTHKIIPVDDNETSICVSASTDALIENVLGYFTLYVETRGRA